jgi:hypothetical protein
MTLRLKSHNASDQPLESTAGRRTERMKDEVKAKLAAASGG